MVDLLIAVIRWLGPFIIEAWLEGGTLREWIRRNPATCIWLLLHTAMLAVVATLIYFAVRHTVVISDLRTINRQLVEENKTLVIEKTELEKRNADALLLLRLLEQQNLKPADEIKNTNSSG